MGFATKLIFAGSLTILLGASGAAWSQSLTPEGTATLRAPSPAGGATTAAAPATEPAAQRAQPPRAPCTNSDALGVGRTVEIDTTGGPRYGFEHFKDLDFLRDHDVVLKALQDHCTTGISFSIGKHATFYPEILKQVFNSGHTVGCHTWSHAVLT